ncbi:MAG: hypothetical protein U0746_08400 [Gemmataceae bacterium]
MKQRFAALGIGMRPSIRALATSAAQLKQSGFDLFHRERTSTAAGDSAAQLKLRDAASTSTRQADDPRWRQPRPIEATLNSSVCETWEWRRSALATSAAQLKLRTDLRIFPFAWS